MCPSITAILIQLLVNSSGNCGTGDVTMGEWQRETPAREEHLPLWVQQTNTKSWDNGKHLEGAKPKGL